LEPVVEALNMDERKKESKMMEKEIKEIRDSEFKRQRLQVFGTYSTRRTDIKAHHEVEKLGCILQI